MIRPLRRAHRAIFVLLALLLPVLLVLALRARRGLVTVEDPPGLEECG